VRWRSVVLTVVLASTAARADTADQLAAAARDLAKAGDFVGAAAKFRAAYAVEPKPEHVCNAGIAYQKAGDKVLPQAQLYLALCLERAKGVLDRKITDGVASALIPVEDALAKGSFTPVDVAVTPQTATVAISAFGPDEGFVGSRVVWVPWGKHTVTVRAGGYVDQTVELAAAAHERVPVRVTLDKKPDAPPPPPPPPITIQQPPPVPPKLERVERGSLMLPIATSGATLVAITVAAIGFVGGHRRADRAAFAVDAQVFKADQDSVTRWNALFGVSGVVALLGAGASGYLWYRALHPVTRIELQPNAAGGAAVMLRGRF
jgi:hypothetical protein